MMFLMFYRAYHVPSKRSTSQLRISDLDLQCMNGSPGPLHKKPKEGTAGSWFLSSHSDFYNKKQMSFEGFKLTLGVVFIL